MFSSGKLKSFLVVLVAVVVLSLAVAGLLSTKKSGKNVSTNELRRVTFSTNGKITAQWLARELAIKKGVDLFSLDISSMKTRLENLQQIRRISIEKCYPDTLSIRLDERSPILKVAVKMNGTRKLFLVDGTDGKIFSPICYDKQVLSNILPANITLKQSDDKIFQFLPLKGAPAIKEFISTLQNDFPEVFAMVKFVNLKDYDSRPGAIWATIELHLKNGIIVVFGTRQFGVQLLRLNYLLNEKCADSLHRIKKINVSSPDDGVLEYK
ncbi:MAG: FtsQ-type POTRA domain-containing protein [Puniceicoccales bacterium]|jgi:cell division septal protein FtsQ|nr:FtsQ-type POTRA domain-containing protein [Puniceicoccales bacterium]